MLTFTPKPTGRGHPFDHSHHEVERFDTGTTSILARVGISLISREQACANAEQEIPVFDFNRVRSAARAEWSELLGRIQVNTANVDPEITSLFYSSIYRTHISPADCRHEDHIAVYFTKLYF